MFDGPHSSNYTASAASIAAGVRKPAALQALELQVRTLSDQRAAVITAIRELIAAGDPNNEASTTRLMKKLAKEREATERSLRPLLLGLRDARETHGEKVAQKLADPILRVAEEIVRTLGAFHDCRRFLVEADDEIRAAGALGGHPLLAAARAAADVTAVLEMHARQMVEAAR